MSAPGLTAVSIGGPTVVLEYGGLRLLTDPTFDPPGEFRRGDGGALVKTAGPTASADDIGAIDAVLLSHDHHADNLDDAGRAFLPRAGAVLTTKVGAERLEVDAVGLEPWETTELARPGGGAVTVTAVPAQHGPDGTDHLTGPVIGFALSGEGLPSVYVSGDNASTAVVERIVERLGTFDIAVLFAGAVRVPAFDDYLTLSADRAVEATRTLGVTAVVPTHHDGWEHFTQGYDELEEAFAQAGLGEMLTPARPGSTVTVPA